MIARYEPLRLTADKREIKDFPKPRQGGASFIRKTLDDILLGLFGLIAKLRRIAKKLKLNHVRNQLVWSY